MEPSPEFRKLVENGKKKTEKVSLVGKNLAIVGIGTAVVIIGVLFLFHALRKKRISAPEDGVEYVDTHGRKIDVRREDISNYEIVRESPRVRPR